MSSKQQVKKTPKPEFKPEKSIDAAEKLQKDLPFNQDQSDSLSMMVMASMTMTMKMDPIAIWCVFFALLSK